MKNIILKKNRAVMAIITASVVLLSILDGCKKETFNSMNELNVQKSAMVQPSEKQLLVSGLEGSSGSAIGPDGALYVTEGTVGKISRVDPNTGEVTTFASGFPPSLIGIGGVYDVTFIDETAYALVTLVDDPFFPTGEIDGIYRVDGPESWTVIANIGEYNLNNPPSGFDFFLKTGLQYAIQTYRDGFLVTDGHLNRILHVTLDGDISVFKSFENIVPTGLEVSGNTIYMAEAGPTPHIPENGKIVSFSPNSSTTDVVASGAPLLVDVELGRGRTMFALSQGFWDSVDAGSPANPDTGSLVMVNKDGTFTTITEELDRPTSLEIKDNKAFIITIAGEIWTVDNIANPPYGR